MGIHNQEIRAVAESLRRLTTDTRLCVSSLAARAYVEFAFASEAGKVTSDEVIQTDGTSVAVIKHITERSMPPNRSLDLGAYDAVPVTSVATEQWRAKWPWAHPLLAPALTQQVARVALPDISIRGDVLELRASSAGWAQIVGNPEATGRHDAYRDPSQYDSPDHVRSAYARTALSELAIVHCIANTAYELSGQPYDLSYLAATTAAWADNVAGSEEIVPQQLQPYVLLGQ